MNTTQFITGKDGFIWFTGVVEDRDDPDKLGRVRVRCVGYHTDDVNKIPTADLPWAWVMMPTTTSSMGGLGEGMPFIVEGSWVVGFWRDAQHLQEPIVIGTLPGIPSESQTVDKGFNDPRNEGATQSEEAYTYKPDFGPYPLRTSDSDVSRLAKNDANNIHPEIEERDNAVTEDVPTANEKKILGDADSTVDIASTWTEKQFVGQMQKVAIQKRKKIGLLPIKDVTQNIHTTAHTKQRVVTLLSLMIHLMRKGYIRNIEVVRLQKLMQMEIR